MAAMNDTPQQQPSEDTTNRTEDTFPQGDDKAAELAAIESSDTGLESTTSVSDTPSGSNAVDLEQQPSIVRAAAYVAAPEKKSHKGFIVGLVSLLAVVLLGAGGTAGWYFVLRTPDIEYDKAIAKIDMLLASTTDVESARTALRDQRSSTSVVTTAAVKTAQTTAGDVDKILDKIKKGQDAASEYDITQKLLSDMKAVKDDALVNVTYDANQKTISGYGSSATAVYSAEADYVSMAKYCGTGLSGLDSVGNIDEYDQMVKPCQDFLKQHETVTNKDINSIYLVARTDILSLIDDLRALFTATSASTQKSLLASIQKSTDDLKKLDTTILDSIEPAKSPKDQLTSLKAKLEENKKIFFR